MDSDDLLSSGNILPADETGPTKRRTPWWVLGVVTVVVAALVGGVAYGVASLSGGGAQPEDALPSGAIAFAAVDLDPPAGQKIDALRYLRQFPSLRKRLSGDVDLRKVLFDAVADEAGWADVDFESQVAPWLGQRVGVGVYPAAGSARPGAPDVVVALQIGDESRTRTGLDRLVAATGSGDKPGYVISDGYALLASSQAVAARAADRAENGAMAEDGHFSADLAGFGDGIATFWVDGERANALLPLTGVLGLGVGNPLGTDSSGKQATRAKSVGRLAFVVRFDGPDVLEVAGKVRGGLDLGTGSATVTGLDELPASTVAAAALAGGSELVDPLWAQVTERASDAGQPVDELVAQAHEELGLDLPGDLRTLLGSNLLVALDREGLGGGELSAGVRVATDEPARADAIVGRLLDRVPTDGPAPVHRRTADGYLVALNAAQATRMTTEAQQQLGANEAFRKALPDLAGARAAAWVDVRTAVSVYLSEGSADGAAAPPDLEPLAGLGFTATTAGDTGDTGSFRLRLVTR